MSAVEEKFIANYYADIRRLLSVEDTLRASIIATRDMWLRSHEEGGKIIFVGNGGSAAIAAHLAIDASKNAGIGATCFNDGSMITCLANDYGFENWMARALRLNARKQDCVVAISSSGKSPNILNAVTEARELALGVVTLSGMAQDNPLRSLGDVNFWANSRSYNLIETVHQFWMMSVIDLIIGRAEYPAS